MHGVIRDVVERQNGATVQASQARVVVHAGASVSGFPAVEHRSKHSSAFKRARRDERVQAGLDASRDVLARESQHDACSQKSHLSDKKIYTSEELLSEISKSNAEMLENMSESQRLQERQEIIDHFGTDIGDLMQRVRKAREKRAINQPATEMPSSESSVTSRTGRKIRFADVADADVHVYESQPQSPRRVVALLPPPDDSISQEDIKSLGNMKGAANDCPLVSSHQNAGVKEELPEDGTPEDIHRRFFPLEPPAENNPSLTWMLSSFALSSPSRLHDSDEPFLPHQAPKNEIRYSLAGVRLSHSQIRGLPTHLGLHHHGSTLPASSDLPAGYTLEDLLLLARSSMPAQRASILGVLAKILKNSYTEYFDGTSDSALEVVDLDVMRRDILDAAIYALDEKGGVGQRAIDILWEAVVGYTQAVLSINDLDGLPPVDFTPPLGTNPVSDPAKMTSVSKGFSQSMTVLASLPLERMLPPMKTHLATYSSPVSTTHMQILDILLVLSHFAKHARLVVDSEAKSGIMSAILTSHFQPSTESHELPAILASIRILQVLARSDRQVAEALLGPADMLLRYVMTPLLSTDEPEWQRNVVLVRETLIFYTVLAEYGLYSHVATAAQNHFTQISKWLSANLIEVPVTSVLSLAKAYIRLLGAWIACSTDPHKTTPPHDILWTQVQGWAWAEWFFELSEKLASLTSTEGMRLTADLWVSICHAIAAWAEGISINGIRGGEDEKALILSRIGPLFGSDHGLVMHINQMIRTLKQWRVATPHSSHLFLRSLAELSANAEFMVGITRLSLALFDRPGECPLGLPSKEIRELCQYFTSNDGPLRLFEVITDIKDVENMPQQFCTFVRPVSNMLALDLLLWYQSMTLRQIAIGHEESTLLKEAWIAQTLQVLPILLPGDELLAKRLIKCLCAVADPVFIRHILHFVDTPDRWECNMEILLPFFVDTLLPNPTNDSDRSPQRRPYISSFWPVPESVSSCSTLMPPSLSCLRHSWKSYDDKYVLPIRNSWPTWPLNHLLHSGSSSAFQNLPNEWDATELDIARSTLILANICREINCRQNSQRALSSQMSGPETIFACMKVFMLEHGQQQLDSSEEVFRDGLINSCITNLLSPFVFGHSRSQSQSLHISDAPLEYYSKGLLRDITPFFQFYTDFVALYDAISFSHPIFARLLLPPIDMSYPIDYRKLLFGDYGHVLRTARIHADEVLSDDIRKYLWPLETNAHMLGWYLKALLKTTVEGFIRWIAIHHIAGNIWPDIDGDHPIDSPRAIKLLSAVTTQGDKATIRDIALYTQLKTIISPPPECFEGKKVVESRLDLLQNIEDHRARETLHALFVQ